MNGQQQALLNLYHQPHLFWQCLCSAEWSTCQLSWRASCGPGIQTRLADCVRSDGCSVDLELCEQHGLDKLWRLTMPCTISCPLNCHLSAWESWSDCSHSCGIEGMMVRHRRVLKSNRANGRPCPEILQQRRPCPVQPCYHWHYGHWSACTLQPSQVQCGEGVRLRNVSCMMSDGVVGQASRIVEDKHCARRDNDPRAVTLSEQIPCTVPCAADCHLSKWSQWSKCQLPCTAGGALGLQGVQARSRARLGAISAQNTDDCPEQTWEARPCQDGKCFDYRWRSGPWVGTERTVWCQRSDGINVTAGEGGKVLGQSQHSSEKVDTLPHSQFYLNHGGQDLANPH
uniref:Spondin-like TSP1 domain-containing protein n=1 Tax=Eptatretus burgeri TaxID=7764 RepID=A0A8C4Q523_EPTBU